MQGTIPSLKGGAQSLRDSRSFFFGIPRLEVEPYVASVRKWPFSMISAIILSIKS